MKWAWWADTDAPSLFWICLLTAKAAPSADRAISIAVAESKSQGWNRSKSSGFFSSNSFSAGPAQTSSAVCCAMWYAASTVALRDWVEKSLVLALPRRCPKNTVTPTCLSRLCSIVSTSPLRTVTDSPWPSDTSATASEAPLLLASLSMKSIISWNWFDEYVNISQ